MTEHWDYQTEEVLFEEATELAKVERLYLGLSVDQAQEKAQEQGHSIRVSMVDGNSSIVTMDLRSNRVNVATENGLITKIFTNGPNESPYY